MGSACSFKMGVKEGKCLSFVCRAASEDCSDSLLSLQPDA